MINLQQKIYTGLVCIALTNSVAANQISVTQTKSKINHIENQIHQVQNLLSDEEKKRRDVLNALQHIDQEIHAGDQQILKSQQELALIKNNINKLQSHIDELNQQLQLKQKILAKHVYLHYQLSDYQPLKSLLNQDDLSNISRIRTYWQYIFKQHQQAIYSVKNTQLELSESKAQLDLDMRKQVSIIEQLKQRLQYNAQNKQTKAKLVQTINQHIQTQQQTLNNYKHNKEQLTKLLVTLTQQSIIQTKYSFSNMRKKLPLPINAPKTVMQKHSPGVIFRATQDTPVLAVYPGKVVFSNWLNGYGFLLIIDHGWGFMTLYANNQTIYKHKGDPVSGGEKIASVGHSGGFQQNGLYFEIRRQGKVVSPTDWLS